MLGQRKLVCRGVDFKEKCDGLQLSEHGVQKNILVIGGTRYFGKRLVAGLLERGHAVTIATRGRTPDLHGDRVRRIRVDRRDALAMATVFDKARYDVVFDQMCYSPLDAAIASTAFHGKVGRYVMASTIEVYADLAPLDRPFREDDLDLAAQAVDFGYPWHAPERADESYAAGKRQAEAHLVQRGDLPFVSVRIAHVLDGPADFTGRLANYVHRVARGDTLRHAATAARTSFIGAADIAEFLCWAGDATFEGPVNAAGASRWSALDLHRRAAALLDRPALSLSVEGGVQPTELSPFDYAAPYVMDTSRAQSLGYRFDPADSWLDDAIREHALAHG